MTKDDILATYLALGEAIEDQQAEVAGIAEAGMAEQAEAMAVLYSAIESSLAAVGMSAAMETWEFGWEYKKLWAFGSEH